MITKDLGTVTAYAYAVAGGYTGTEEEFETLLGNIATDLEEIENLSVTVSTLPEGSTATASYSNGVLSLGIPRGNTGATGNGVASAVLNGDYTLTLTFTDGTTYTTPSIRGATGATGNGIQSVYKTGESGAVKTYTILFTDGTTFSYDVTDGEVTNASLTQTLEDYALVDGYYEEMTVGDAEQLVASQYVDNSVPYVFRTTGGSSDVGNRAYVDDIVGGSIAWNQLALEVNTTNWFANNSVNSISASDGVGTITVTAPNKNVYGRCKVSIPQNHVVFYSADIKPSINTAESMISLRTVNDYNTTYKTANCTANTWSNISNLAKTSGDATNLKIYLDFSNTVTMSANDTLQFKNAQCFDLTQMFGSTVADYIHSLEQNNAGDGVAYFKALFPKPYYAYNAGTLLHVNATSHDTVGFNQWDEEWEVGGYNYSNGTKSAFTDRIRCKNPIRVIPNTNYFITGSSGTNDYYTYVYYDADGNYISGTSTRNHSITMPENACYFCFNLPTSYGTTYNNDICINLSWSGYRNGEYEPYEKHTYALDSDLILRGIPKLDGSNNLYYDGDTYAYDGTVTRKFGITSTLSTDNVQVGYSSQAQCNYADVFLGNAPSVTNGLLITTKYLQMDTSATGIEGRIKAYSTALTIYDSRFTDVETAINILTNENFVAVYRLATPTTESADAYQNIQICDDFGTEEFVVTEQSGVAVPVGHNTRYPANLRDKLQHLPDLATTDGTYAILQSNKQMSLTTIPSAVSDLPDAPTTDGTYTLTCTVSGGVATYSWEA